MDKTKLAICLKDLEYQARFVNCFMNHYKHQYEVHVFTHLSELKTEKPLEYAVIITGEYTTDEMADFVERGEQLLVLTSEETGDCPEGIVYTQKFQEVYKIAELLHRLVADRVEYKNVSTKQTSCKWLGVYALTKEEYQIPFSALLARIYGEEKKVLVLDLQHFSGLSGCEEESGQMGLEDLLSVAITGSYSKGRLLDCMGHESNWDYVYPVKNNQYLLEGSEDLYETLLELFEKELDYEIILINFGAMFSGQLELMERCKNVYLLGGKDRLGSWREETFVRELERSGKEELLCRIKRVELPIVPSADSGWRGIAEKWYWNAFGERMRQMLNEENAYGAVM